MSVENCKLKLKCDTTTHLLEWLKYQTLGIPNIYELVEQKELLFFAGENVKWHSHFGSQLTVSYNSKRALPCDLTITLLGI